MSAEKVGEKGGDEPKAQKKESPEAAVHTLEEQADHLREELGQLVGELDKRRHRLAKPLLVAGGVAGVLVVAGFIVWQVRSHRRSGIENLTRAVQRAAKGERTPGAPSVAKRILGAAAAAAAGVLTRRLAQYLIAPNDSAQDTIS